MLLAKNRAGYKNLIKLSSIGFTEGFYRRPRIDKEVLARALRGHRLPRGLPVGRGGALAPAGQLRGGASAARRGSPSCFGPDGFWLEIQKHGIPEEDLVTEGMLRLGQELGLGVVATNDAHYLRREDAEAHDVLLAIGTGADLDDPKRFRFTGQESYVKSRAGDARPVPGATPRPSTTPQRVAELCEFDFEKRYFLPSFPRPAEYATDEALLERSRPAGRRAALRRPAARRRSATG